MREGSVLTIAAVAVLGAVAYGYADANKLDDASSEVYMRVIEPFSLAFDTADSMRPFGRGQLFVEARFSSDSGAPIARMHVEGDVFRDGKLVEHFDSPCQRRGSIDLTLPPLNMNGEPLTTAEHRCFVKLKTELPVGKEPDGNNSRADISANEGIVASMSIKNSLYSAASSRRPMMYVVWINQALNWLATPFRRS